MKENDNITLISTMVGVKIRQNVFCAWSNIELKGQLYLEREKPNVKLEFKLKKLNVLSQLMEEIWVLTHKNI